PSRVMDFYRLSFFGGWSCAQLYVPVLEARWSLRRISSDFRRCGGIRTRRGRFLSGTTLRQDKSGNQCEGYQKRALGHGESPDFRLLISNCQANGFEFEISERNRMSKLSKPGFLS